MWMYVKNVAVWRQIFREHSSESMCVSLFSPQIEKFTPHRFHRYSYISWCCNFDSIQSCPVNPKEELTLNVMGNCSLKTMVLILSEPSLIFGDRQVWLSIVSL